MSTSETTGVYAFLDTKIHPLRNDSNYYGKTSLVYGSAGPSFGTVVMFHSKDYYGGIVFHYWGSYVRYGFENGKNFRLNIMTD